MACRGVDRACGFNTWLHSWCQQGFYNPLSRARLLGRGRTYLISSGQTGEKSFKLGATGKGNDSQQSSEEVGNQFDEQGHRLTCTREILKTAEQDRKGPTPSVRTQIQKWQEDSVMGHLLTPLWEISKGGCSHRATIPQRCCRMSQDWSAAVTAFLGFFLFFKYKSFTSLLFS